MTLPELQRREKRLVRDLSCQDWAQRENLLARLTKVRRAIDSLATPAPRKMVRR